MQKVIVREGEAECIEYSISAERCNSRKQEKISLMYNVDHCQH